MKEIIKTIIMARRKKYILARAFDAMAKAGIFTYEYIQGLPVLNSNVTAIPDNIDALNYIDVLSHYVDTASSARIY